MDGFFGIPLDVVGNLGATGLVAVFVIAILLGRLVPSSVLRNGQQLFEVRVAEARKEAETWRNAFDKSEEARRVLADQAKTSVELAESLTTLMARISPDTLRGAEGR